MDEFPKPATLTTRTFRLFCKIIPFDTLSMRIHILILYRNANAFYCYPKIVRN